MDKKKLLKTALTSGLMLVGTLVSTGNVNADEVKPVEAEQPKEETKVATKEDTVLTQDTTKIDEAVEKAKKEELEVKKTENTEYVLSEETAKKLNEEKQKELDEKAKEIDEAVEKYKAQKEEQEKKIKEAESQPLIADKDKVKVYGEYNEDGVGSLDYYNKIKVIAKQSEIGTENLTMPFSWTDDTTIEAVKDVDISKDGSGYYVFKNYKEGSQFYIRNVAKGETKGVIDLLVTLGKFEKAGKVSENWFSMYKGSNYSTINASFYAQKELSLNFKTLDKKGNTVNTLQTFIVSDVDYNQGSKLNFEHNVATLIPTGSELTDTGEQIKDVGGMVLDDYKSTPRGTYAVVGYGSEFNYTHYANPMYTGEAFDDWWKKSDGAGTAFALFGNGANLEVLGDVIKPVLNYDITKYEYLNISPQKAVEKVIDGENVDGSTIQLNEVFYYHLKGGLVPANRSEVLNEYAFVDDFDETGDKYNDKYTVKLVKDVTLKDGTVLKAGTDVTEFTSALIEAGKVTISFKSDFLKTVSDSSVFQSDSYLEFTRINVGTFENTYVNKVNGKEFKSNTVKTVTPPPATPNEPNKSNTPELPNTGTETVVLSRALGGLSLALGGLVLKGKKKK